MKSKTGALLTKIAAIINLITAGIILLLGIILIIGLSLYQGLPFNLIFIILLISLIIFAIGLLLWNASEKMKNPKTVRTGAIIAIVVGVLSISSLIGILALIGGIIALIDSDK